MAELADTPRHHRTVYRGRFAPSPSGPLHLGSLYTALASFLQARSRQGEWLLRIDNVDPERSSTAAADSIRRTLENFGLCWDGPVVYQQGRLDRYRSALDSLRQEGLIYGCRCSRKRLIGKPVYPGYCRHLRLPNDRPNLAQRVITAQSVIRFHDTLHGDCLRDLGADTGDFIVRRRDGAFAYHLATVVDDADAEISEVLRGSDLLASTPRQVHLQRLLRLPTPTYCHTPVLTDADGHKLSKQTLAAPVESGNTTAILMTLLTLLRQSPPAELHQAPVRDILSWAIANWDVKRLQHAGNIPVASRPTQDAAVAMQAGD